MQLGSFKSVLGGIVSQLGFASTRDLSFGPTASAGYSGVARTLILGKPVRTIIVARPS